MDYTLLDTAQFHRFNGSIEALWGLKLATFCLLSWPVCYFCFIKLRFPLQDAELDVYTDLT